MAAQVARHHPLHHHSGSGQYSTMPMQHAHHPHDPKHMLSHQHSNGNGHAMNSGSSSDLFRNMNNVPQSMPVKTRRLANANPDPEAHLHHYHGNNNQLPNLVPEPIKYHKNAVAPFASPRQIIDLPQMIEDANNTSASPYYASAVRRLHPKLVPLILGSSTGRTLITEKLVSGGILIHHRAHGKPKHRLVWCSDDLSLLFWGELPTNGVKKIAGRVQTDSIINIIKGHHKTDSCTSTPTSTPSLGSVTEFSCVSTHCFTLQTLSGKIHLEAISTDERDYWSLAFAFLLDARSNVGGLGGLTSLPSTPQQQGRSLTKLPSLTNMTISSPEEAPASNNGPATHSLLRALSEVCDNAYNAKTPSSSSSVAPFDPIEALLTNPTSVIPLNMLQVMDPKNELLYHVKKLAKLNEEMVRLEGDVARMAKWGDWRVSQVQERLKRVVLGHEKMKSKLPAQKMDEEEYDTDDQDRMDSEFLGPECA